MKRDERLQPPSVPLLDDHEQGAFFWRGRWRSGHAAESRPTASRHFTIGQDAVPVSCPVQNPKGVITRGTKLWLRFKDATNTWVTIRSGFVVGQEPQAAALLTEARGEALRVRDAARRSLDDQEMMVSVYKYDDKKCPACDSAALVRGDDDRSWICAEKRSGCGITWPDGTKAIEEQPHTTWRYRKRVKLPDGRAVRIGGTPAINTKAHAERAERAAVERLLADERPLPQASLPHDLAALLDEDDIPERLAAHVERMRRRMPSLKFTKRHAARALLVKALRIEEQQEGKS